MSEREAGTPFPVQGLLLLLWLALWARWIATAPLRWRWRVWSHVVGDLTGLGGIALLAYGAYEAWPPAGFMAAGACLFLVRCLRSLKRKGPGDAV